MATDVTMPRLSDSMEEGTILKWLVDVGAEVKRGEPLVEVETDKANMTYDADTDGVLVEVVASEGDTLAVGELIARIGDASEVGEDGGGKANEAEEKPEAEERPEAEDRPEAEQLREGEERDEAEEDAAATAASGGDEGGGDGEGEAGGRAADAGGRGGGAREHGGDAGGRGGGEAGGRGGGEAGGGGDGGERREPAEPGTATRERQPAAPTNGDGGRVKASPVARRVARELGVELARLEGSGPGGRIVKADVEQAAKDGGAQVEAAPEQEQAAPAPPEAAPAPEREEAPAPAREPAPAGAKGELEVVDLTRLQQTVSRRMAESKATAPDFALEIDVDMTGAVELRTRLKQIADPAPSFNDMVVKAAALALREHPRVNGAYRDGKFELYPQINVGVAVAAQDALVVPVVQRADERSLGDIARQARELAEKVRDGNITPPELSGATFTVSNLGMFGIDRFTAIINPPQAAILSVGRLAKRPAVDDTGRVVARDQMTLTLVCDHRILYGADGAQFLARVKELLEQPLALAL
jgi:pyruvate dehydrogenase E2 component (dihydrolipoyllysine-residue acetyltransferase)